MTSSHFQLPAAVKASLDSLLAEIQKQPTRVEHFPPVRKDETHLEPFDVPVCAVVQGGYLRDTLLGVEPKEVDIFVRNYGCFSAAMRQLIERLKDTPGWRLIDWPRVQDEKLVFPNLTPNLSVEAYKEYDGLYLGDGLTIKSLANFEVDGFPLPVQLIGLNDRDCWCLSHDYTHRTKGQRPDMAPFDAARLTKHGDFGLCQVAYDTVSGLVVSDHFNVDFKARRLVLRREPADQREKERAKMRGERLSLRLNMPATLNAADFVKA